MWTQIPKQIVVFLPLQCESCLRNPILFIQWRLTPSQPCVTGLVGVDYRCAVSRRFFARFSFPLFLCWNLKSHTGIFAIGAESVVHGVGLCKLSCKRHRSKVSGLDSVFGSASVNTTLRPFDAAAATDNQPWCNDDAEHRPLRQFRLTPTQHIRQTHFLEEEEETWKKFEEATATKLSYWEKAKLQQS